MIDGKIKKYFLPKIFHGIEVDDYEFKLYLHYIFQLEVKNFACWTSLIVNESWLTTTRECYYCD